MPAQAAKVDPKAYPTYAARMGPKTHIDQAPAEGLSQIRSRLRTDKASEITQSRSGKGLQPESLPRGGEPETAKKKKRETRGQNFHPSPPRQR
jgi:hypothetical protein